MAVAVYLLAVIAATLISIERTPAVSPAPVTNNNTNIINDPRNELRKQYADKAWETVKEKSLNAN